MKRIIISLALLSLLAACGTEQPKYSGLKIGKPYQINGRWYKPKYEKNYDEVGLASWYGPGFHGGQTASGERYDQDGLTAAHKTLPFPAIVRVTNLENGKSAIIKVNDRGPFVGDRLIDLSKGSAKELGIYGRGLAKVRIQFLDDKTREYVESHGGTYQFAASKPAPEPMAAPLAALADAEEKPAPDIFSVAGSQDIAPFHAPTPPPPPHVNVNEKTVFLQIGVFGVKENANKLLEKLASIGQAKIIETNKKYRVVMGGYNSQYDVDTALEKLAAIGINDIKIIKD